jgi:hypothetical protein
MLRGGSFRANSLYFSLLAGNLTQRLVRYGLGRQPYRRSQLFARVRPSPQSAEAATKVFQFVLASVRLRPLAAVPFSPHRPQCRVTSRATAALPLAVLAVHKRGVPPVNEWALRTMLRPLKLP